MRLTEMVAACCPSVSLADLFMIISKVCEMTTLLKQFEQCVLKSKLADELVELVDFCE